MSSLMIACWFSCGGIQYTKAFDLLAFEGAKRKLVQDLGYPEEIMSFQYDPDQFRRGLIIDKKRGNVIKIDRHKYVRTVFHGLRELTSEEKKNIYSKQFSSFKESSYANIDTIFLLVGGLMLFDYRL
jgi:5'-nucleotidase